MHPTCVGIAALQAVVSKSRRQPQQSKGRVIMLWVLFDVGKRTMKRVLITHNGLVATVLAPPATMAERTWRYRGVLAS